MGRASFLPIRHSLIIMRKAPCSGPSQRDSNTPIQPREAAQGKMPQATVVFPQLWDSIFSRRQATLPRSSACSSVPDNRCPSPNELRRRASRPGNQLARRPNLDTGASRRRSLESRSMTANSDTEREPSQSSEATVELALRHTGTRLLILPLQRGKKRAVDRFFPLRLPSIAGGGWRY
jgi:hypothetical protein